MRKFLYSQKFFRRFVVWLGTIFAPSFVFAADAKKPITPEDTGLKKSAEEAGLNTGGGVPEIIGNIIGALLAVLGTVFFIIIIVAGIRWMTAAGNEEQVTKSKNMIVAAILGLVVIFLSYALVRFLGSILSSA